MLRSISKGKVPKVLNWWKLRPFLRCWCECIRAHHSTNFKSRPRGRSQRQGYKSRLKSRGIRTRVGNALSL